MAILTPEQIAQVAYQAGFRGAALETMVAIAWGESGRNSQAYNGAGGDNSYGLWQINMIGSLGPSRLTQFGIPNNEALFDPLTNAKAAFILSGGGANFRPWTVYTRGTYNNYLPASKVSVQNAYNQGLIPREGGAYAVPYGGGSVPANQYGPGSTASDPLGWATIAATLAAGGTITPTSPGAGFPTGTSGAGQVSTVTLSGTGGTAMATPFRPPSDGWLVRNDAGWMYMMFDVGGAYVAYMIPPDGSVNTSGMEVKYIDSNAWAMYNPVDGGMAGELESVSKDFGTYRAWWDSIVLNVMGKSNPAANDPGVKRVLAEYAARPDMSTQELQNRLQATDWYQSHTQTELQWNNLSTAEKDKQRQETSAKMQDLILQYMGADYPSNGPGIVDYLEQVSSGKIGLGQYTEVVKNWALYSPESPWSRQLRDEKEAELQRGVDIENTTNRVRDLSDKWGVQLSQPTLTDWGQKIVSKQASDQDLLEYLKDQAMVLFPWKDRETDTTTAAQPWLDTYNRVMEKQGSVLTPQVGQALTAGKSAWDFEQDLKKTDDWLGTKNAKETMTGLVDAAGRRFGFA